MDGKGKKICWLIDVKGWAFDNRARNTKRLLPGYDHTIVRASVDNFALLDGFDIVVCDFLPWMKLIPERNKHKVVLGLRSFRALEFYEDLNV